MTDEPLRSVGAIVLLGPPGAGKGTQANRIAERYGIPQISTGNLLRGIAQHHDGLGAQIKRIMARGELVPDDLVCDIVAQRLRHADCARGFVLDGFPRTSAQADWLDGFLQHGLTHSLNWRHRLPIAILIQVDKDQLLLRLTGRRICPSCGRIYNMYLQPPRADEICDVDASRLIRRDDDREEVVRERLRLYEQERGMVEEYYRDKEQLFVVDGNRPVDQVTAQIVQVIEEQVMQDRGVRLPGCH
jgi:adenylate kinase